MDPMPIRSRLACHGYAVNTWNAINTISCKPGKRDDKNTFRDRSPQIEQSTAKTREQFLSRLRKASRHAIAWNCRGDVPDDNIHVPRVVTIDSPVRESQKRKGSVLGTILNFVGICNCNSSCNPDRKHDVESAHTVLCDPLGSESSESLVFTDNGVAHREDVSEISDPIYSSSVITNAEEDASVMNKEMLHLLNGLDENESSIIECASGSLVTKDVTIEVTTDEALESALGVIRKHARKSGISMQDLLTDSLDKRIKKGAS